MDLGLRDRVCVVTGASRGIGLAVSRLLAAEDATVLMVARGVERLRREADALGAEWLAVDVTEPDADARIVGACAEQLGGIDVLVNNAGTSSVTPLHELTDEDFRMQFDLNVVASARLMRAAAPRMAKRGWGRIVNVASSSGKRPSQTNVAYSAAKAAQLSVSRAFADAYAADGILVNAVMPGMVASELWLGPGGMGDQLAAEQGVSREQALASAGGRIPLGRMGTPEQIADVVAFLCSERAANVTGAAWSADGGSVPTMI
jgi:3-oxoacyl-[acyl-carrier protein] reductase